MRINVVLLWIVVAVLAIIIEILTPTFFVIWFAGGAIAGIVLHYLGFDFYVQIIGFILASSALILFSEKILKRKIFHTDKVYKTNIDAMVNQEGTVVEEIKGDKEGRVQLRGTTWIAYTNEKNSILVGEKIIVEKIDGVKLKVRRKEEVK